MREVSIAELRKHTKEYFDAVEQGDVVRVLRNGRPIAEIVPVVATPSWKRKVPPLRIPGVSLTREILKDRLESEG